MRKSTMVIAVGTAFLLGAALVSVAASRNTVTSPMTVHVIEHANTDIVIDTDQSGTDTSGDLLTWYNPIFNETDTKKIGHDQGQCIRMNPADGSWQCQWTTWVGGGTISVEGPFYDTHNNSLAITGGTGMFRNARGVMLLKARDGGTEYDFIFNVLP